MILKKCYENLCVYVVKKNEKLNQVQLDKVEGLVFLTQSEKVFAKFLKKLCLTM